MNYTDKTGGQAAVLFEYPSFDQVLNVACDRLWDKKVELTIRRIRELQEHLDRLEHELTMLIPGTEHDLRAAQAASVINSLQNKAAGLDA
jgi:hypothetical protein